VCALCKDSLDDGRETVRLACFGKRGLLQRRRKVTQEGDADQGMHGYLQRRSKVMQEGDADQGMLEEE
jgi:hypothetical protein